jgi:hypothetical protein
VLYYLAAMNTMIIWYPLYSLDTVPSDYFLLPRVKAELTVISMAQENFRGSWDGVSKTIAKEDFTGAIRRQKERCEKCERIGGDYVEKYPEIKFLVK